MKAGEKNRNFFDLFAEDLMKFIKMRATGVKHDTCWVAGNRRQKRFLKRVGMRKYLSDTDVLIDATVFESEWDAMQAIKKKLSFDDRAKKWRLKPIEVSRTTTLAFKD